MPWLLLPLPVVTVEFVVAVVPFLPRCLPALSTRCCSQTWVPCLRVATGRSVAWDTVTRDRCTCRRLCSPSLPVVSTSQWCPREVSTTLRCLHKAWCTPGAADSAVDWATAMTTIMLCPRRSAPCSAPRSRVSRQASLTPSSLPAVDGRFPLAGASSDSWGRACVATCGTRRRCLRWRRCASCRLWQVHSTRCFWPQTAR
jgi:hypothetical protein